MRYYEPKIQELVQEIQGVFRPISDHDMKWRVEELGIVFKIRFILFSYNGRIDAYSTEFCIERRVMTDGPMWENLKYRVKIAILSKLIDSCSSAKESDINYSDTYGAM